MLAAFAAQPSAAQDRRQAPPQKPSPRWPNGRIRLGMPPGEKGLWIPYGRPILAEPETDPAIKDGQGRGAFAGPPFPGKRSEEHTSELQSRGHLVCRLLLEKKKE